MTQPITAAREAAPRGGLASAVGLGVEIPTSDPLDPGGDWERDTYRLEGPACRASYTRGDDCEGVDLPEPGVPLLQAGPVSHPFTVEAAVACSTFGSLPPEPGEWRPATDRLLEMCQWSEIAYELWTGAKARAKGWDNRYLASSEATVLSSSAVSPAEAVSLLEDALSVCTCGGVHVLHVPIRLLAFLSDEGLAERQGERIFTLAGSLVVADSGYPGTGPGGVAPTAGQTWIYGTPRLTARLGGVRHAQEETAAMVDPRENSVRYRAERRAAISWLCCHFAVNVRYC